VEAGPREQRRFRLRSGRIVQSGVRGRPRDLRSRPVAGRGRSNNSSPPTGKRQRRRTWLVAKPFGWALAVIGTAVSGVLVAALTAIPGQVIDDSSLGDRIRRGPDILVSAEAINDDGNYTIATNGPYDIPMGAKVRNSFDLQEMLSLLRSVRSVGGFDVGRLRIRLILQGNRNRQIQVTGLEVSDVEQLPVVRGTLIQANAQGGVKNERVVFDLSDDLPRARIVRDDGSVGGSYFAERSISLQDREQVVLLSEFRSRATSATKFRLRINYIIDGQDRAATIDDQGRKFAVTPPSCNQPGSHTGGYDKAYVSNGSSLQLSQTPSRVYINCP